MTRLLDLWEKRMAKISAVKRRNAWRQAIREVGVLFVAFGLGDFAYTIFSGKAELLPALFLAILLNVAGLLAINFSIETEEETDAKTHEAPLEEWEYPEPQREAQQVSLLASSRRRLIDTFRTALAQWKSHQLQKKSQDIRRPANLAEADADGSNSSAISEIASSHD
jgi:hypothetical protein